MTAEELRPKFEEFVFRDYFVKNIRRNDQKPAFAPSGCMDFVSTSELNKAQLCERKDESYARPEISAMWHGFKLCLEAIK